MAEGSHPAPPLQESPRMRPELQSAIDRLNHRFLQLHHEKERLFWETIQEVLPTVERVVVADESGILKMLPIASGSPGGGR